MENYILQFNFETGDTPPCAYHQVYVVVKSQGYPDFESLEDSIISYFESNFDSNNDKDLEYKDNVEDIMRESGMNWEFARGSFPESKAIHSLWI